MMDTHGLYASTGIDTHLRRHNVKAPFLALFLALTAAATPLTASAAEQVDLVLNWTPTADHAPIYYAKQQGWYEDAGIQLKIEAGRGSSTTAQRVGAGAAALGISDFPTAMQAMGKGAALDAVMIIYANSPQGFYWLKSSGIRDVKDFPGRKIGNPPGDASRQMWPAFASAVGIAPDSVKFVNLSPQAKVAALKAGSVDIISDFYNEHDLKVQEFGDDLAFLPWRDIGINVYGNAVLVNHRYLEQHPELVKTFVGITQKAYAKCVEAFEPCLQALMADVSGLSADTQRNQWARILELMRDDTSTTVALGAFDMDRVQRDYELVNTLVGLDKPFDPLSVVTNDMLSPEYRMP